MNRMNIAPTGHERTFGTDEQIVSKTDQHGKITYANDVFLRVAGYTEREIIGAPHSIIRHPTMPRCVFKLLWDTIEAGNEIFAYVINLCKNGDHYWVFAHVTPSLDENGNLIGYHSSRRVATRSAIETVEPIYAQLLEIETNAQDKTTGMELAGQKLLETIDSLGVSYGALMFQLQEAA